MHLALPNVSRIIEDRVTSASKIVATDASWIDALAWQALQRIDDAVGETIVADPSNVRDIRLSVRDLPDAAVADSEYFLALAKGRRDIFQAS